MAVPNNEQSHRGHLRKQNHLSAVLGALIVFMTFVLKEGVSDHLKDLVSSINSAQVLFAGHQDSNVVLREAGIIENTVVTLCGEQRSQGERRTAVQTQREVLSALTQLSTTRALLNDLNELIDKAHLGTAYSLQVAQLNDILENGRIQLNYSYVKPDQNTDIKALIDQNDESYVQSYGLAIDVLRDARAVREKRQHVYDICSWASYGTYTIGWALALIAALYGKSEAAADN